MLGPCEMELINIAVLKEDAEQTVAQLLKLGNFHPVDIRRIESGLNELSASETQKEAGDWEKLAARLRQTCASLDFRPSSGPELMTSALFGQFSYSTAEQKLNAIDAEAASHISKREELREEIRTRTAMLNRVPAILPIPLKRRDSSYSFLEVASGTIADNNLDLLERSLSGIHSVVYPFRKEPGGRTALLLIGLRRDKPYIEKVLSDTGFEKKDFSGQGEAVGGEIQLKLKCR